MKFTISITLLTILATASAAVVDTNLLKRQPACGQIRAYCGEKGFVQCCPGFHCGPPTSGGAAGYNECAKN